MLAAQERFTLCCTGATPLPLSAMTGEVPALLANDNDALAVPDACGRNVTVNGMDCPGDSVVGNEIPLTTNSVLVLVADDTVTDDPLAVNVPLNAELEPSVTLPKFNAVGVSVSCPAVAPVPASATFNCESDALEKIASVPDTGPDAAGENATLNVRLCPAARFAGNDSPPTANAELETLVPEIVTLALPVFVSVSIRLCELPGRILPKLKLVDDAASRPVAAIPVPESPAEAEVTVPLYLHFFGPRLLDMEALTATDPPSVPVVDGAKVTLTDMLCPGDSEYGKLTPPAA